MGMEEEVLCIKRWAFDRNVDHFFKGPEFLPADLSFLLAWNVSSGCGPSEICFVPRSKCENDPRWLQIIPYILVVMPDHSKGGHLDLKVLAYNRPSTGGEARLCGKASIGVGGHINPIDSGEWYLSTAPSVMSYVVNCASRELEEELGVEESSIHGLGWLMDPSTDVGLVHVGAVVVAFLPKGTELLAQKEILNPTWIPINELANHDTPGLQPQYNLGEYEAWSRTLINSGILTAETLDESRCLAGVPNFSSN